MRWFYQWDEVLDEQGCARIVCGGGGDDDDDDKVERSNICKHLTLALFSCSDEEVMKDSVPM